MIELLRCSELPQSVILKSICGIQSALDFSKPNPGLEFDVKDAVSDCAAGWLNSGKGFQHCYNISKFPSCISE